MLALTLSALLAVQQTATASDLVVDGIRTGRVGERYDGYLDFVSTPSASLRRAVGAINIRRRALYADLGGRTRIAPREVGMTTACKLLLRVPEGGAYQLADGEWRTRTAETPLVLPTYCPKDSR
ncbi:YdbL family protein [Sphingomicrobium clamense]|uniref:YdbL family protein n=1 Tax=Sphingomicrobium clamense TaxID=2851013 RepID=A0ABS6V566_9SPHN|nr:YdbL family protein [Sphingomicrobium sp. B8]MBW0144704.1 YdbL family protein [Sphingomicrobium sp. B8]